MKKITIYPVGGISAMFEPHIVDDPFKSGARGAGLGVKKAAKIVISIEESEKFSFENYINGKPVPEGIGRISAKEFFEYAKLEPTYKIRVEQEVYIPIGSGFGSSAASAVAIIFGLSRLLKNHLSLMEIAQIAHVSEVKAQTGLGTVSGLICPGGIIIVKTPGPPGISKIDKILLDEDLVIVAGSKGKIETDKALKDPNLIDRAIRYGKQAVDALIEDPSIETFFEKANWFAREVKLSNETIEKSIKASLEAGAIGAAQTMIGDAVFALVEREKAENVRVKLSKTLGVTAKIFEVANSPLSFRM